MKILVSLALLIVVLPSANAECRQVPNSSPAQFICVETSPLVESGSGSQWSKWYTLKTTGPKGYSLTSLIFRLEGPHPCAADFDYSRGVGSKKNSSPASSGILGSLGDISKLNYALIHFDRPTGLGSWAQCREKNTGDSIEWEFCFQGWTRYVFDWNGSAGGPADANEMMREKATMQTVWIKEN
jgi:hypothetical protein